MTARWSLLILSFFLLSCFGIDRRGGIVRYQGSQIYTGQGEFTVGQLPPSWKGPKIRLKQLLFENDELGATILTDAICGPKFDDGPLPRLANELFAKMGDQKLEKGMNFLLNGRQAYRLRGGVSLDGVPLRMEVVVVKKDFCLYDFVYFAPPQNFAKGEADFEDYFRGFKTR